MITPNEEIKLKEEVAKAYKIYLKNFEAGDMNLNLVRIAEPPRPHIANLTD